ncbi:MAG: SAM-dependent methyltransferase, partial [Streptosporangiaceae bacterium]
SALSLTVGEPDQVKRLERFDASRPNMGRVYDYWLGGKDNFLADREAAEQVIAANPGVVPGVWANRAFLGRAVRYLAGAAGIRQFLDLGTGLPTGENTHEVAQAVAPDSRIVYVDHDPIVLMHARELLRSTPEGGTAYLEADIRDLGKILTDAARLIDLSRPVAVMALMILQYIPDSDDPWGLIARLMSAVPAGSYLVISDTAKDIVPESTDESQRRYNERLGAIRQTRRTFEEFSRFFDGLVLVEPGVVPLPDWRAPGSAHVIPAYAGMARKP